MSVITDNTNMPAPRSSKPRIAVIGGLTRATHEWKRAGAALGVVIEHHDGNTTGHRAALLAAIVRRADVVVTMTIPNSHNGVAIARRTAAAHRRAFMLVKRMSPSTLATIIADVLALARIAVAAR
jgi:hypothetical protein